MRLRSPVLGKRQTSGPNARRTSLALWPGRLVPTSQQMAISVDVNDAANRTITFPEMVASYRRQVEGLVAAGVDILMPETAIDTLNLKACLFAIRDFFDEGGRRVPVMVSGTFDKGGRTFVSGQSIEAFVAATAHFPMLSVGMNCALGPDVMRPHLKEMSDASAVPISCHPNAGLPNDMGEFDLGPKAMADIVGEFRGQRLGQHSRRMLWHDAGSHRRV